MGGKRSGTLKPKSRIENTNNEKELDTCPKQIQFHCGIINYQLNKGDTMCEISRSIDNLGDKVYDIKEAIRDIDISPDVSTYTFEQEVRELNVKFNTLAELFCKLAGVDVYKTDLLDKRVRHRKDVAQLSSEFDLQVRGE